MSKQAKVVYVSEDGIQVSLNVGKVDGVSQGDSFLIYELSEHEIIDPDTNESLGYLEFVKGTGKVVHLQDRMCTIASAKYKNTSPTKTIKKEHGNPMFASFISPTIEETIIEGEKVQIPFDNACVGHLAKKI